MSLIVNDLIEDYVREKLNNKDSYFDYMEEYAHKHKVPIVQKEVAKFLDMITRIQKPSKILEIGTAIGYSGSIFAKANPETILHTIEIKEDSFKIAEENFKKQGIDNVVQYLGDASQVLNEIKCKFDLIFIDASKGHYQDFFEKSLLLLEEGGIIISDNILYKGMIASDEFVVRRKITIVKRMRSFIDYITTDDRFETSILPFGDGMAITKIK